MGTCTWLQRVTSGGSALWEQRRIHSLERVPHKEVKHRETERQFWKVINQKAILHSCGLD